MRLLEGAHAAVRAGHEDAHAFFAAHGVFGRAAGVAAGGAKDIEFFAPARQFVFKQVAQQLHGHVFEGQRGAVGQSLQVQTVFKPRERHDGSRAEHFFGIRLAAQGAQIVGRNVVHIQRQNLKRQVGIRQAAPAGQGSRVHLRIGLGQIQAAIGRQAFKQDFAKALGLGWGRAGGAGGDVTHQASSSLRMRTMA